MDWALFQAVAGWAGVPPLLYTSRYIGWLYRVKKNRSPEADVVGAGSWPGQLMYGLSVPG